MRPAAKGFDIVVFDLQKLQFGLRGQCGDVRDVTKGYDEVFQFGQPRDKIDIPMLVQCPTSSATRSVQSVRFSKSLLRNDR